MSKKYRLILVSVMILSSRKYVSFQANTLQLDAPYFFICIKKCFVCE